MLSACAELMTQAFVAAETASHMVWLLLMQALACLPPLAGTNSRSSSSSGLTAMLWEQLEQSGFLQQLPAQLGKRSAVFSLVHASCSVGKVMSETSIRILNTVGTLQKLQPSFLTAHAAGRHCVVPAMQYALATLQFISTVMVQTGQQKWMEQWLGCAWDTGIASVSAATAVLHDQLDQGASESSRGASSSQGQHAGSATAVAAGSSGSGSSNTADALAVLQAEQTLQWCCLDALVPMLAQFLQEGRGTDADTASGLTSSSSSAAAASSSSRADKQLAVVQRNLLAGPQNLSSALQQAANSGAFGRVAGSASSSSSHHTHHHHQHSHQSTAGSSSGRPREQWLPAALAPSMPKAYSFTLEQLGCSREVGLWLAERLNLGSGCDSAERGKSAFLRTVSQAVQVGLQGHGLMMQCMYGSARRTFPTGSAKTAVLHLSVAAISLQWLSSLPPGRLSALTDCAGVCGTACDAYDHGQAIMQHQDQLQLEQQAAAGDRTAFLTANRAVLQLSAAVLPQLLSEYRSEFTPNRQSSTGSNTSSSSGNTPGISNSNSRGSRLVASYQNVALMLASAWHVQATAAEQQAASATTTLSQQNALEGTHQFLLPVLHAQCCKLLQDCVRLVAAERSAAAAAAASPSSSPGDSSCSSELTSRMLQSVTALLGSLSCQTDTFLATSGPLVAPLAAAGDVSSIEALQLFGLLCSLLKLYSINSSSNDTAAVMIAVAEAEQQQSVATAAFSMLSTALGSGASHTHPSSSSSPASSCACAAALPWLALLGRFCCTCAVRLQQRQDTLEADTQPASWKHFQWLSYRDALAHTLQQLQSSLLDVVQWLGAAGTVQQLTALGYQPQDMQQQLAGVADALKSLSEGLPAADAFDGDGTVAMLKEVQMQMQTASRVLACFATPHACNNPACSSAVGPSEAQLVGGRSCICAGCRTARYCGRACQRVMWRQHKPVCKALAAAAAAAAAAGGVAESPAEGGSRAAK